eukprot:scaffold15100_cov27-Tisochrysis_lutea.AAC.5
MSFFDMSIDATTISESLDSLEATCARRTHRLWPPKGGAGRAVVRASAAKPALSLRASWPIRSPPPKPARASCSAHMWACTS